VGQIYGVDGNSQRLEHDSIGVAKSLGDGEAANFWPGNVFSLSAIFLSMPGKTEVCAQVGVPLQAEFASFARHSRVDSHALPNRQPGISGFFYNRAKFMPENQRALKFCISYAAFAEPMQVRGANANSTDAQQNIAGLHNRFGLFVQT
jgi:hypothetical protein